MPWKIVNLDYACDRPHLHLKDPNSPIHLRSYFDERTVEIAIGADDPDDCPVRAKVSPEEVAVSAIRFRALDVTILSTILTSLDVEPQERDAALGWMHERLAGRRGEEAVEGNVASFPAPTGWPYDLTDDALVDSIEDPTPMPGPRRKALLREAARRRLPIAARYDRGPRRDGGSPEIIRRRR